MGLDVRDYVLSCPVCQRGKTDHQRLAGTLQPLQFPKQKWKDIAVDFVTGLPVTDRQFDAVMTVVDRCTKMVHLVPMKTTDGAQEVADHFQRHIWKLHGIPRSIVSDRDGRFISAFWKELMRLLGTQLRMSSAFHPQTDGQSEKANDVVETTLRLFTDFEGREWDKQLPVVEFTVNNTVSAATGYTPFYLNQGYHPHSLIDLLADGNCEENEAVDAWARRLSKDFREAENAIEYAQKRMKQLHDRNKQDIEYHEGDKVLLSMGKKKQLLLTLPGQAENRKLRAKYVGPFEVQEKISAVAYRLKLPRHFRLHPVFHIDRLKPWKTAQRVNREIESQPQALNREQDVFRVEKLLKTRTVKCGRKTMREFLVKWAGFPLHEATWEPE